jgi:hypothetical protein
MSMSDIGYRRHIEIDVDAHLCIREHDHELRKQNLYHLPNPRIELFKRSPLYQLPFCCECLRCCPKNFILGLEIL